MLGTAPLTQLLPDVLVVQVGVPALVRPVATGSFKIAPTTGLGPSLRTRNV